MAEATIDRVIYVGESGATVEIVAGIEAVRSSVAVFDKIKAGIAAIQAEHPADVVFDLTTPTGMRRAIAGRAAWRNPRIALGKARQEAKAPVLALGRQIDAFAASVEAQLRVGENHYHELIEAEESRREAERQAKARAEEERVEAHRQRIGAIRAVAARAVGMTAEQIAEKIALVTRQTIDDDFEEFVAPAINAKAETLLQLQDMHEAAVKAESAAAEAERNRIRLAELERENAERLEREQAERAVAEAAAAKRKAQAAAADALVDELRQIGRRAFAASSAGMLELVTLVENIAIGAELGDFEPATRAAKDLILADLHEAHAQKVRAEAETAAAARRLREAQEESDRLERLAELRRAEIAKMDAPQAGPAGDGSQTPDDGAAIPAAEAGQDAHESALAGDARPCTDPVAEAAQATTVGDEGKIAHAEERAIEPASVSTGEIARRLGFTLPSAFIEDTLGILCAAREKRALLWAESQWIEIKAALVRHIEALA